MEVKKEKDDEYCGKPEEKAKELHGHTFYWTFGNEVPCEVLCEQARTIYESLQTSPGFKEKAFKNLDKELVILRPNNKPINSNFPCHKMTEGDTLTIKYISEGKIPTTTTSSKGKKENEGELVTFGIRTTGGKNLSRTNVMKNVVLGKMVYEVIVFGYKGQTVREALEQDGRFSDSFLKNNNVLEETEVINHIEMSRTINRLDGRCFKIAKKLNYVGTGKDDAPKEASSSKIASSDIPTPNQPTPNTSHQSTPTNSDQLNREEIYNLLRSQFPDLTKCMKGRQKNAKSRDVRKLFSREFGKNVGICKEIRSFRKLVELGDSVCQVKINGGAAGSGFLLFGKYILTNAHVVLDEEKINLRENISVVFSYEDKVENPCLPLLVTVVALSYHVDKEGYKQDWALLEVDNNQNTLTIIPQPLLKLYAPVTESGHICIIGHPEGKVKMLDPCFTIPRDECEKRIKPDYLFRDIQTYDSCFYEGSSGSPVFDHNFKVVSMHTGGFPDKNTEHAIEYAHPLSLIIEEILMDIVRHRKLDVLLAMITCGIPKEVKAAVIEKVLRYFDKSFVCTENDLIELANSSYCKAEQKHLKDFFLDFNPWIPRDLV